MSDDENAEIRASVAAHRDLGPGYDEAVAEGLVERIGAEIDKRIDARLGLVPPAQRAPGYQAPPPPAPTRPAPRMPAYFPLASMGLGVGATAIVTGQNGAIVGQVFMVALIWLAIAIINIAYARRH
jgi:hypothetical protein